ncbi:hypothetical protein MASR2M117_01540 [Paludibacter sp.]
MKSKFIYLLAFLAINLNCFAGINDDDSGSSKKLYLKFGPKYGSNFNVDFKNFPATFNDFSTHLKNQYQIGGFVQFGRKLYIQPEFHYCVTTIMNGTEPELKESFQVPLHVGLKFFNIGLLSLHISGGAVYSQQSDETFSFTKDNIGYQLGAGVDIFDFITTDVRYTLKSNMTLGEQISDLQSNGGMFNVTVGLKF